MTLACSLYFLIAHGTTSPGEAVTSHSELSSIKKMHHQLGQSGGGIFSVEFLSFSLGQVDVYLVTTVDFLSN